MAAYFPLFVALNLWGFSFIGARWVLTGMTPLWGTSARFFVSFFLGLVLTAIFQRKAFQFIKQSVRESLLPGLFLGGAISAQILGLQHTSVANSAFITTLYVVFVPVIESFTGRKLPPRGISVCVILALVGATFMTGLQLTDFNIGDVLTLLAALLSAVHILYVGKLSLGLQSPFLFNVFQALWAGVLATTVAPFMAHIPPAPTWLALAGVLFLAGPVHLGAFTIQIHIQRKISPSISGLLFLMESPLAALFAYWIFGEPLGTLQAIGAALITLAAYLSLRLPSDTLATQHAERA
jgi:drug/metabolite transporter (DMT)-like permease